MLRLYAPISTQERARYVTDGLMIVQLYHLAGQVDQSGVFFLAQQKIK